jgi:hypothetical protein
MPCGFQASVAFPSLWKIFTAVRYFERSHTYSEYTKIRCGYTSCQRKIHLYKQQSCYLDCKILNLSFSLEQNNSRVIGIFFTQGVGQEEKICQHSKV